MSDNYLLRKFSIFLALLIMFFNQGQVLSEEIVKAENIKLAVKEFLASHGINGTAKIDPLVKMKPCENALAVAPYRGQFKTLTVSCPDSQGWRLILAIRSDIDSQSGFENYPVRGNAKSHKTNKIQVWVANRTLRSGTVILPDHISLELWDGTLSQSFQKLNPPFGRKLRKTVTTGKPVRERHLIPHWDIRKGENATLKSSNGSINIITSVMALENAFVGERVRVKNFTSDREMLAYLGKNNIFQIQPLKMFTVSR